MLNTLSFVFMSYPRLSFFVLSGLQALFGRHGVFFLRFSKIPQVQDNKVQLLNTRRPFDSEYIGYTVEHRIIPDER